MVSFSDHYNAISIDRLPSKTKIGKRSWKRFRKIIIFHVSPSSHQLQRLLFSLKTQKTTTLQQVTGGEPPNVILKRIVELFLKVPPFKKILEGNLKFVQKHNSKQKIKTMIENLQNELYELENKQAKRAKLCANIRQELEGEEGSKTFVRVLERQNMQIQTIFELHTDDNE